MALTKKGQNAAKLIKQYFPNGKFSAQQLSQVSGEQIVAATLNGIAKNGYIKKYNTSPVTYEVAYDYEITENVSKKSSANDNLHRALKEKNDEFYTYYEDVKKECDNYIEYFKDKNIYLNCDGIDSKFWQYFIDNFVSFGLKTLIATSLEGKKYITKDGNNIICQDLIENGDFTSLECQEIIQESDIIITNPPFSRFREMIVLLEKYEKKFLLIGNENSLASTEVFPLLKSGRIWLGYNKVSKFLQPDGTDKEFGNISWYTNLPVSKENPFIKLTKTYEAKDYPKYDNFNAINVDKVSDIPEDYCDIMGVPISYLSKYNPNQFSILGLAAGNTKTHKLNYEVEYTPHPLDRGGCGVVNGVRKYSRVFIKKV